MGSYLIFASFSYDELDTTEQTQLPFPYYLHPCTHDIGHSTFRQGAG